MIIALITVSILAAVLLVLLAGQHYKNKYLAKDISLSNDFVSETRENFRDAFQNLANRIFEEKSEKFTKQNKENLLEILNPLKEDIEKFKNRIAETDEKNRNSHTSLIQQIKNMENLNRQIG